MLQPSQQLSFVFEALPRARVTSSGLQHFERHLAAHRFVLVGEVDGAEPALAEHAFDRERADALQLHGFVELVAHRAEQVLTARERTESPAQRRFVLRVFAAQRIDACAAVVALPSKWIE